MPLKIKILINENKNVKQLFTLYYTCLNKVCVEVIVQSDREMIVEKACFFLHLYSAGVAF